MWKVSYMESAVKDLDKLDNSQRKQVLKGIEKVRKNPLSVYEGGYGKPLGNKRGTNLTNLFKIKLKSAGIRIVYQLIKTDEIMEIVIISMRADELVYEEAAKRLNR